MPQGSLNVTLGDGMVHSSYIFAVSRNSADNVSGGMVWSHCAYDKRESKFKLPSLLKIFLRTFV